MPGTVYTWVGTTDPRNNTQEIDTSQGPVKRNQSGLFLTSEVAGLVAEGFLLTPGPAVSPAAQLTALTAAAGSSGALTGVYKYVVTFVTAAGETKAGPETTVTLTAQQASLSNIPVGSSVSGVTARKIYRTAAGGSSGSEKLAATISDNTTTTATDNLADGSLGAVVPVVDTAGVVSAGGGSISPQDPFLDQATAEALFWDKGSADSRFIHQDGTGMPGSVASVSSLNTFTKTQTVTPPVSNQGLEIIVPASTGGPDSPGGLYLSDTAADSGGSTAHATPVLQVRYEGTSNAVDLKSLRAVTAGILLALHSYGAASPVMQIDQTNSAPILKLTNAQNSNYNPGNHGTGNFLELWGYYVYDTTRATGTVTGGNTLADANGTWTAEDVGKPILVGAITTTIATVASGTQITTASSSLVNGSSVSYSYATAPGKAISWAPNHLITNASTVPLTILSSAGAAGLSVQKGSGGVGIALDVLQTSAANGVRVQQQAQGSALFLTATSAASGNYIANISPYDYGVQIATSQNGGIILNISKTGTGAGTVVQVKNSGTGVTFDIQNAGGSVLQVLAGGQIKFAAAGNESTGAGSAALGANCPAVTATAPYTWEKVTTSDGSQGYIPVWK